MPTDCPLKHGIADSVHLRNGKQQEPQQDTTAGRAQPVRSRPEPVDEILAGVQDADEAESNQGRQHAEAGIQQ